MFISKKIYEPRLVGLFPNNRLARTSGFYLDTNKKFVAFVFPNKGRAVFRYHSKTFEFQRNFRRRMVDF